MSMKETFIHALALACVLPLAAPRAEEPTASGAPPPAAVPSGPRMVIIQPGYPGSTRDAEGFVGRLSAYVAERAGLAGLSGEYHNEEKAALAAVGRLKPAFGVVSLGFYLEHRAALGLKPLLASKPRDNFVLVARSGELKDLSALKGQPVAGGPLYERPFLERIAFAGKADVAGWDAKPVLHASRALRDLVDRKKYAAVVLTGRDYRTLSRLYQTKTLEKVLESEYYPPAFLVAFGTRPRGPANGKPAKVVPAPGKPSEENSEELSGETAKKVERTFSGLAGDPKGKEILETMGAEGFEEIRSGWSRELEGRYDARSEEK